MNRPDYQKMYDLCYRKYHELLKEVGGLLEMHVTNDGLTVSDTIGSLQKVYEKHVAQDWRH